MQSRSGEAPGRFGETKDDQGGSREASQGASEAARGLPRRSRSVPKAPESTPRRPWEASGALFRSLFSQSVSQEAPEAIFDRILSRLREVRGLSHCTGAVFREGRPFFVGVARRPPIRPKSEPRTAPDRGKTVEKAPRRTKQGRNGAKRSERRSRWRRRTQQGRNAAEKRS